MAWYAILTTRANMPMPKVYVIPSEAPNAFATGRNPSHAAVAATEGLLKLLSREELAGVMAHELAHVRNRDILIGTVAATIAGAIGMLASMAQWAMIFGGGRRDENGGGGIVGMIAMMIIAPIAAGLIQMAISRSREYQADATGARNVWQPPVVGQCLEETGSPGQACPDGRHPGHCPHVHSEPAPWRWNGQAFQHTPSNVRTCRPSRENGLRRYRVKELTAKTQR